MDCTKEFNTPVRKLIRRLNLFFFLTAGYCLFFIDDLKWFAYTLLSAVLAQTVFYKVYSCPNCGKVAEWFIFITPIGKCRRCGAILRRKQMVSKEFNIVTGIIALSVAFCIATYYHSTKCIYLPNVASFCGPGVIYFVIAMCFFFAFLGLYSFYLAWKKHRKENK